MLLAKDTLNQGSQLPHAVSFIISLPSFVHDLHAGLLNLDNVRGHSLDTDQYMRLFIMT